MLIFPTLPERPERRTEPVPKHLHLVWVGSEAPASVTANWYRWRELLDDSWTVYIWTEANVSSWPLTARIREAYPELEPVVIADLVRLEQVWKHGGVYVDSDVIPLQELDSVVGYPAWIVPAGWYDPHNEGRVVENVKTVVSNSMFAAPPQHPFIAEVLNHAFRRISAGTKNPLFIAGPNVFQRYGKDVAVLRHGLFPDIDRQIDLKSMTEEQLESLYPEALGVHLANRSWYGSNHSMTNTPTFVMAVPWVEERKERAIELATETQGLVVWDETHNAMDTWRKTMGALGKKAGIVLEDDVVLADGWRDKIEAVIEQHPNEVIQFFSMRGADLTVGSRYEPGRTFMMNQCYYLPAGAAEELLEFSHNWETEHPEYKTGYDILMSEWMRQEGLRYWLQVPSLVQHERWTSEINSKRPRTRQSKTFSVDPVSIGITVHVMTASGIDAKRDENVLWWETEYAGKVCVHDDVDRNGILWNHREIIKCASQTDDPWVLVVQDDARPIKGWEEHLRFVMETAPTDVVSLSHFSKYGEVLAKKGSAYGIGAHTVWGQAVLYRQEFLPGYLELVERVYALDPVRFKKWDDGLVGVYNLLHGTQSSLTARALFEHQDWKSTVGNVPGKWRHAALTIADDGPAYNTPSSISGTYPNALQKALVAELSAEAGR
jgi:hypothetical protein